MRLSLRKKGLVSMGLSLFASPLGFGQSVELVVKSGAGEVLSLA